MCLFSASHSGLSFCLGERKESGLASPRWVTTNLREGEFAWKRGKGKLAWYKHIYLFKWFPHGASDVTGLKCQHTKSMLRVSFSRSCMQRNLKIPAQSLCAVIRSWKQPRWQHNWKHPVKNRANCLEVRFLMIFTSWTSAQKPLRKVPKTLHTISC